MAFDMLSELFSDTVTRGERDRFDALVESLRERRPEVYEHMLVPDRERLDRFLAGLLDSLNPHHYRAAAVFEIIPPWLRFLEARGLIDAEARARALSDLADLADKLRGVFESGDPAPRQACERWREQATKALPE